MSSIANRKLKNYIVDPKFQLKIVLYFTVLSLAICGVLGALMVNRVEALKADLAQELGLTAMLILQMDQFARDLFLIVVATFAGFTVLTFFYTVIITHRISGPVVAICRYIDDIKAGKATDERNLRSYDELKPVMDKLNELVKSLKK